jgi:MFS family permease
VWRIMFLIGILPSLLAIVIRRRLKEPKRWQQAVASGQQQLGSYSALFGDARWRRRAIAGMLLASVGVIGLWAIAFFSVDLTQSILDRSFREMGLEGDGLSGKLKLWAGITLIMLNFGAFLGISAFSLVTHHIGRRPAFAIFFVLAAASTVNVFLRMESYWQIIWMVPLMGFCQFALFGGYAIYFPELFPTRLRSTGTSFCYNVGRFVAASGPWALSSLTKLFGDYPDPTPLRYAGATLCSVFVLGLLILPFLPETRGEPLPE